MASVKAENVSNKSRDIFTLIEIVNNVQDVLEREDLFYRQIDNWLSVQKRGFDCFVNNEPHHAVIFLLDMVNGQFIIRVWSKTLHVGYVTDPECLKETIQKLFTEKVPCIGVLQEDQATAEKLLFCEFPFSRMISTRCNFLAKLNGSGEPFLCEPCCNVGNDDFDLDEAYAAPNGDSVTKGELPAEPVDASAFVSVKQESFDDREDGISDANGDDWPHPPNPAPPAAKRAKKEKREALPKLPSSSREDPEGTSCNMCSDVFSSFSECQQHKRIVHLFGTFNCAVCTMDFELGQEFIAHTRESHEEIATLPCGTCREEVNISEYANHLRDCMQKRKLSYTRMPYEDESKMKAKTIPCNYCDEKFVSTTKRNKHHKEVHNKTGLECEICSKSFTGSRAVYYHRAIKHGLCTVLCKVCGVRFLNIDLFMDHYKSTHPEHGSVECFHCKDQIPLDTFSGHIIPCTKSKMGKKWQPKGQGIKCRHCDEYFPTHFSRKSHEAKVHIGMKYTCEICGYGTPHKHIARDHKLIHEDNTSRETFCQICGKKVNQKTLRKHIQYVHEGKKDNATCEICGETFDRTHHLKSHMNLVHDAQIIGCHICGRRFGLPKDLAKHMDAHQEGKFECKTCGKILKKKSSLTVHERTHTGEKPFGCDQCDMAYPSKLSLYNHVRYIHEKVPYAKKS